MWINKKTTRKNPSKRSLPALTMLVFIGAVVVLSLLQFGAPPPKPAGAPPSQFSAARAMDTLASFAQTPHPLGSAAQTKVRDILLGELAELGLEPEIQQGIGVNPVWSIAGGPVENIVARMDGTDSSGVVLLMAHYDSVVVSPGAGDDGTGVVVILESLRALQSETPLKNDVIILLTDGEEMGLLGAYAFRNDHPWVSDVRVVINLEGCLDGPMELVETGRDDGWFVREFARAVSRPRGTSLSNEVVRWIPQSTDFAPFKKAGYVGGMITGLSNGTRYHTPQDRVEQVNVRTLQSYGSQVLALMRHLGAVNLDSPKGPDTVFFPLFGPLFVYYPLSLAVPLAAITSGLFSGVLILGLRRKQLVWKEMGWGLLILVGTMVAAFLLVTLTWQLLRCLRPEYTALSTAGIRYNDRMNGVAFIVLAVALFSLSYTLAGAKIGWSNLTFGALWLWLVLTVGSSLFLPRGSYLFTWPLLFSLLHQGWVFYTADPNKPALDSWSHAIGGALSAGIGIFLCVPMILSLTIAFGMGLAAATAVLVVLFLSSMLFQLKKVLLPAYPSRVRRWGLPGLALLVAFASMVGALSVAGFDAAHPQPTQVDYLLDTDGQEAFWINTPDYLSPWETQFVNENTAIVAGGEVFPPWGSSIWGMSRVRQSPAAARFLPAPNVEVLEDSTQSGVRTLLLQITSFRQSDMVIFAAAPDTDLLAATVHDQSIVNAATLQRRHTGEWVTGIYVSPLSAEDTGWHTRFELALEIGDSDPVELIVADRSPGLPGLPGSTIPPRPPSIMQVHAGDGTFVIKRFVF